MVSQSKKVRFCLLANILLLLVIILLNIFFASDNNKYFRFGPNKDLIIISIQIDSYQKYFILLMVISFVRITKVIISEIGEPVLDFSIYNPDKKIITEFKKNELYLLANSMYFIADVRRIFQIMVTISQIDIALYGVFMSTIASLITTRLLINEKKFIKKNYEKIGNNDNINNSDNI